MTVDMLPAALLLALVASVLGWDLRAILAARGGGAS